MACVFSGHVPQPRDEKREIGSGLTPWFKNATIFVWIFAVASACRALVVVTSKAGAGV